MNSDLQIHPPLPARKDFRIGILGSGFVVNEGHLPAYRKAGFNPVAIASRHRSNAERVAQRHGVATVYDSYEQLLADPSIEVLDIAVPPNAQAALIAKACACKTAKGILAQTPLGADYPEAVDAVTACKAAGIALSVNQTMRYDPSVRAAKTLLMNGALGEAVFATIEMRGDPQWRDWQKDLGWATLRMISIHHLDCFRYWLGEPEGIYCSTRPDPRAGFEHSDGICSYILEYANGCRCVGIDDVWAGPAKDAGPTDNYIRWRLEGLKGLAIGHIGWRHDSFTIPSIIKFATMGDKEFHQPGWTERWFPDGFIGTMAQLLIAVENGTEPAISGDDNLKTMRLVEAAYTSAEQFTSISLEDFQRPLKVLLTASEKAGLFGSLFASPQETLIKPMINFTPRAQQVLAFARKEADRLNHHFVGTEHLLLGLIKLGQGVAFNVMQKLGLNLDTVCLEVERLVGTGPDLKMIGNIPYTPRVKKVLAFAAKEAKALNHTYVGTEHVLLGLIRESDGIAGRVLKKLGVDDLEQVRIEILKELDPNSES